MLTADWIFQHIYLSPRFSLPLPLSARKFGFARINRFIQNWRVRVAFKALNLRHQWHTSVFPAFSIPLPYDIFYAYVHGGGEEGVGHFPTRWTWKDRKAKRFCRYLQCGLREYCTTQKTITRRNLLLLGADVVTFPPFSRSRLGELIGVSAACGLSKMSRIRRDTRACILCGISVISFLLNCTVLTTLRLCKSS